MLESRFDQERKRRCEGCREGAEKNVFGQHKMGTRGCLPCTAPSLAEWAEELAAERELLVGILAFDKPRETVTSDLLVARARDAVDIADEKLTARIAKLAGKLEAAEKLIHDFNRAFDRWACGSEFHNDPKRIAARISQLVDGKVELARERNAAVQRAEAAERDTARLDWLEYAYPPSPKEVEQIVNAKRWNGQLYDSVRDAIDAARKTEEPQR